MHPVADPLVFRRHSRALFASAGKTSAAVLEREQALVKAIRDAGLADKLRHLLSGTNEVVQRSDQPFELFIVGEGKYGKSTLVNALMGAMVAPADFTPKTWCFNRYVALPEPPAHVRIFVDPGLMADQDCKRLRGLIGAKVGEFRGLHEYRVGHGVAEEIAKEEERRVISTQGQHDSYWSPVMEMEWGVSAGSSLVPGIRLVDTMGMNQKLAPAAHQHHMKWQYERADAVLWLVAAEKLNSEETRNEITEARRYAKVLYIVISRWDAVQDSAAKLEAAHRIYDGVATSVLPVSSFMWLAAAGNCGLSDGPKEREFRAKHRHVTDEQLRERSGMLKLRAALEQFLDSRQFYTRNVQQYSAAREKDREFRRAALAARSDAQRNIELHDELTRLAAAACHRSEADVIDQMDSFQQRALSRIEDGLRQITYDNRPNAHAILGLDGIASEAVTVQHRLATRARGRFESVVAWAADPTNTYTEPEFHWTGRVACTNITASLEVSDMSIKPIAPEFQWPNMGNWWQNAVIWVLRLFGGADQKMAAAAEEFRQAARGPLTDTIASTVRRAVEQLLAQTRQADAALRAGIDDRYEAIGGQDVHQKIIAQTEYATQQLIVDPLLIAVPLRIMRRLGWRK